MKVRRAEFKRARWYKRRKWQRNPPPKMLKAVYEDLRFAMPTLTPLSSLLKGDGKEIRWGGTGVYFETSPGRAADYAGHRGSATEEPVNYVRSGRALS